MLNMDLFSLLMKPGLPSPSDFELREQIENQSSTELMKTEALLAGMEEEKRQEDALRNVIQELRTTTLSALLLQLG